MYMGTDRNGLIRFSLANIMSKYNIKQRKNKGESNEQFTNIITEMNNIKLIEIKEIENKMSINKLFECTYNGLLKNEYGNYIQFTRIERNKFNKILNCKSAFNNISLLFYYCYLCSRIHTRKNKDGDVTDSGGYAEVCYPSYKTISEDIDLSEQTIKKYNDILVDMDLIRIGNLGLYYVGEDKKLKRESPNFYTLVDDNDYNIDKKETVWYSNLKYGMNCYKLKHPEYNFLDTRQYVDNDRSNNCFIGTINRLEKEGKATKKQILKRDKLINDKVDIK